MCAFLIASILSLATVVATGPALPSLALPCLALLSEGLLLPLVAYTSKVPEAASKARQG
jgi:hypothetical protein